MKREKVLLLAGGMTICMAALLAGGVKWTQVKSEKQVVKTAAAEVEGLADEEELLSWNGWGEETLYREAVDDQKIVKQVCKKYGLDYESVTMREITRQMRNYEEAFSLLKNMGDKPLLAENASDEPEVSAALESLESYIGDIYAFDGGREVIAEYCEKEGIDPNSAVVSDLTADQIVEIGELAFEISDHSQN